jgi:hypothetical protein
MRVIEVPPATLQVRYEDDEGDGRMKVSVKTENYFWYVLKMLLRQKLAKMSAIEMGEFEDCNEEILAQVGKDTLKITRESEYEKITEWVKNYVGWPGKLEDVCKNTGATRRAFEKAEKVKPEPKPKAK